MWVEWVSMGVIVCGVSVRGEGGGGGECGG